MQHRRRLLTFSFALLAALVIAAPAFAETRINSVWFSNATNGYIGGFYGADSDSGFFGHTADGGLTWSVTTVPDRRIIGVHGVGANAWAVSSYSPRPFYTANSGASWTEAPVIRTGFYPSRVVRLLSGRLVAVGQKDEGLPPTGLGQPAAIYTSDDGGVTWVERFKGPAQPRPDDPDLPTPGTRASMVNAEQTPDQTAIVAIANEWSGASFYRSLAYASANGGSTWITQTIDVSPSLAMNCLTVASNTTAFAFGQDGQYMKGVKAAMGHWAWTKKNLPTVLGISAINVNGADARGSRIVAVGAKYPTASYAMIAYSYDAGATWTYRQYTSLPALYGVAMLSDTEWIAVGRYETMLRTTDGGVTWSQISAKEPVVSFNAPAAGFAVTTGTPVAINVTATDAVLGVDAVDYNVRRFDGRYWNGTAWQSAVYWLPASRVGTTSQWTASWMPEAEFIESGQGITVTARATDLAGAQGTASVKSTAMVWDVTPPAVTISTDPLTGNTAAGVAPVTVSMNVTDNLVGVKHAYAMVQRTDGLYWSGASWITSPTWLPAVKQGTTTKWESSFTPDVAFLERKQEVTITALARDMYLNERRVTSTWRSGIAVIPYVRVQSPQAGSFLTTTGTKYATGIATDSLSKVAWVHVRIRRTDGRYWNGSSWVTTQTWRRATLGSAGSWSLPWTVDSAMVRSGMGVVVTAKATDIYGNYRFAYVSTGVRTPATLSAPYLTMIAPKYYNVRGFLKPQHTIGSNAALLQCYHYEKKSDGTYGYVLRKTLWAKAAAGSTYETKLYLSSRGKWRIRAYHSDLLHAPSVSAYRYITVQ